MEWDSSASERKAEARTMPVSTVANFCFSLGSSVTISQSMRAVSIPVARRMRQRAEQHLGDQVVLLQGGGFVHGVVLFEHAVEVTGILTSKEEGVSGGAAVAERISRGFFLPLGGYGTMGLGAVDAGAFGLP